MPLRGISGIQIKSDIYNLRTKDKNINDLTLKGALRSAAAAIIPRIIGIIASMMQAMMKRQLENGHKVAAATETNSRQSVVVSKLST